MAKGDLGPYVQSMSGRVVNSVFVRTKTGKAIIRAMPAKIDNPNSKAQSDRRQRLGRVSHDWAFKLTLEEQNSWDTCARENYRGEFPQGGGANLITGCAKAISGMNAFCQANMLSLDVGGTELIRRPKRSDKPNGPGVLRATFDGNKVTINWDDIAGLTESQFVRVWMWCTNQRFHNQFIDYAPGGDKTCDIYEVRAKKGKEEALSGLKGTTLLIQADVVDRSSGYASTPSSTIRLKLL